MEINSWKEICLKLHQDYMPPTFSEISNPLVETYLNEANKLNGSNFINWKFKMLTLMQGYGIWTIAKGDEAKPNAAAGATTTQIYDWDKR